MSFFQLPQLRKELEDLRYQLALESDCPANSVYSNTVIEGLVKIRPTKYIFELIF